MTQNQTPPFSGPFPFEKIEGGQDEFGKFAEELWYKKQEEALKVLKSTDRTLTVLLHLFWVIPLIFILIDLLAPAFGF